MKVKIFCLTSTRDEKALQTDINAWMAKNDIEVFKIIQSESCHGDLHFMNISIFYRPAE